MEAPPVGKRIQLAGTVTCNTCPSHRRGTEANVGDV